MAYLPLIIAIIVELLKLFGREKEVEALPRFQQETMALKIADVFGITNGMKFLEVLKVLLDNKDAILEIVYKILDVWNVDDRVMSSSPDDAFASLIGILET